MFTALLRNVVVCAGPLRSLRRLQGRRLVQDKSGATAVEFSLVAAPFLALLVGLVQTAVVFLAGRELDEAVAQASRYILTGQAQNQSMTQAQFSNWVCQNIYALFNCNNLMVNVQSFSSFASATTSAPTLTFNAQGQVTNTWTYNPGGPGDIVVVQVMYQWPIVLGPLGFNLSNLSNGDRLLMSTAVFKNEPY
jgi:Flp pilus assembly protein TadG